MLPITISQTHNHDWLESDSYACCPGAMVPFSSQEDVDFFSHLELHLRQEHPPLAGRDHMAFRGSYYPVSDLVVPWCSAPLIVERPAFVRHLFCSESPMGQVQTQKCSILRSARPTLAGAARCAAMTSDCVQVKDVIDGDLCEQYSQLPAQKQKQIAEDLERSPGEVLKKLEDIRNQIY